MVYVSVVRAFLCLWGALWCSGLCTRLVIRESWVRITFGAYALGQGILPLVVSLDSIVENGYPAGIYSFDVSEFL